MSPPPGNQRKRNPRNERESMRQAFERALGHAQTAAAESVAGVRAMIDAASIGVTGAPADRNPNLGELASLLDQLERTLSGEAPSFRNAAINSVLRAVDREVARWEARSKDDPDARAVLRVFLGMREVLWEIGVRPQRKSSARSERPKASRNKPRETGKRPGGRARVQRIPIQR